jgi:hypothetical protein
VKKTVTQKQKKEIRRLWGDMSLSVQAIGERLGLSKGCVSSHAHWMGLPERPRRGPPLGLPCFRHRTCRFKWRRILEGKTAYRVNRESNTWESA